MGRPKKAPEDTYLSKKKLKAEEKMKQREEKTQDKQERRELWLAGRCKAPDGSGVKFKEVERYGADGGKAVWDNASEAEKEKRKEAGREAFGRASEEQRESIRTDGCLGGAAAWAEATDAEKEKRKAAGAAAWDDADETERGER